MGANETPRFPLDTSGKRIVVDPVTRIEGHMRCEVTLDSNNVIRNAVSTGTMWRGLEVILKGRDPRDAWAFVERICGVCTSSHALTSVRAVEDALGIKIPKNAHLIREIMAKAQMVQDHVVHFYHLHALDWVDVVACLKADPKKTSELQQLVSPAHGRSSPGYFRDIQNRVKKFVESGQLGPFRNGYWGSKAYILPAEANLMAVAHYLEALDLQKEWIKIHAIFGGKNPHPNYLVGGMPCAINIDRDGAAGAPINMERLNFVKARIDEGNEFYRNVYLPDVLAIGTLYKHAGWLHGGGLAGINVMERRLEQDPPSRSARPRAGTGIRDALLVQVRRRHQGPAPLGRRDRAELRAGFQDQGHTHRHQGNRRKRQILLDQGTSMARPCHGGRSFGALHPGLCARLARQQVLPAHQGASGFSGQYGQQRYSQGAGTARDAIQPQTAAAYHDRPHRCALP